ncbi:MAG: 16S rRNA (uracil(1498)-N(3))-methyltransferase [Alphaproteobacteria bacterium]|nr:16S rRNA (uracil(1498)-N(3))-methyltransferase [Alphaproteobacteria bacterium]NDC55818.1 16S rRNA (uracil(1498)-N(3))-methyltransferase [Alphaproteobacteria bacterium]
MQKPHHLLPRFFVEGDFSNNTHVTLMTQHHQLVHVRRLGVGDGLVVFNAEAGAWRAEMTGISKKSVQVRCVQQVQAPAPMPDVWLYFAPIKSGRLENIIEKATELGVGELCPIITQHTQVQKINMARLQSICIEAAEQCERLTIPRLHAPQTLKEMLAAHAPDRVMLFCAEAGEVMPIHQALASAPPPHTAWSKVAILTGPEGGFSAEELALVRQHASALAVGLGPLILRADTAALAALACWQSWHGNWAAATAPRPPYQHAGG